MSTLHLWPHDLVCETCDSEVDFPDEHAELGICRHCGLSFLVDLPSAASRAG